MANHRFRDTLKAMLEVQAIERVTKVLLEATKEYSQSTKEFPAKDTSEEVLFNALARIKEVTKDDDIRFLNNTNNFCINVEKAIQEIKVLLSTISNWNAEKDRAYKGLVGTLRLILQITNTHINALRFMIPNEEPKKSLAIKVTESLQHLANELDDTIENLELVIKFYNKEKGNDLQIALDRLEDKDDPVITSDELRKLLGL